MKKNDKYAKYYISNDKKLNKTIDKVTREIKRNKKKLEVEAKKLIKVDKANIKNTLDKKCKDKPEDKVFDYEADIQFCNEIIDAIESNDYCKYCVYWAECEEVCAYPGDYGCSPKAQVGAIEVLLNNRKLKDIIKQTK